MTTSNRLHDGCGCCGEWWKDCICPKGPVEDQREVFARWAVNACSPAHEIDQEMQQECAEDLQIVG